MQFYPIVYTRTNQTIYGLDFHYKARPGDLDEAWRECVSQLINEDHFPRMKRPRRIFVRTQNHLFWGIALHNQWFLPQEIRDRLKMDIFGDNVRGFWGGLLELGSLTPNEEQEALSLIASSLVKNRTVVNISDERQTPEGLDLGLSLPQSGLYSRQSFTEYPFACRLFQLFIEQDWNNHNRLVYQKDAAKFPHSPVMSEELKDLASLAEKTDLMVFRNDAVQLPEERANFINMIPSGTCNEESAIVQAVLSGKPCAIITGIEKKEHATRFLKVLPGLNALVDEIQSPCAMEKARSTERHVERHVEREQEQPEPPEPHEFKPDRKPGMKQERPSDPGQDEQPDDSCLEAWVKILWKNVFKNIFFWEWFTNSGKNGRAPKENGSHEDHGARRDEGNRGDDRDDWTSTPNPISEDEVERFRSRFAQKRSTNSRKECANDDLE